ncbi:type II toxin-antitoxin system HipA family toxin [Stenotrophomonas sp. Sa5BUN4]|uniref:Type II toxin-antitoxin system HipA family toxin n=1 Tax=Stenotrophomonas lacuserhaii TaxID=2760084 RepID=A0A8X8FYF4_9GAMM|nr:type II toxin-antitoxin system HipA family toxin [Stenotrophomonas pennii]MBD7953270.1 type II toxin-antitoxin system HipA family toxin [Stenotrophomonas pennii]
MLLAVLLADQVAGTLTTDRNGDPNFVYSEHWLNSEQMFPVSLSLPLTSELHLGAKVSPVLWGLLPDNETLLQRWGSHFHVSPRNPVALLSYVGEDCAGAIQFVTPERVSDVLSGADDGLIHISDVELEERLASLRADRGASSQIDDIGQFSLAGAQSKIALHKLDDGRWAMPSGRIPTTHILKPPSGDFEGYVENEMFCLRLASLLGLPSANVEKLKVGTETAICVERYDRLQLGSRWIRIHQEDFCQALGVMPHIKYQSQGGPGPSDLATIIRAHSSEPEYDSQVLLMALMYNYLIGGTDAHAKNYSLLFSPEGSIRLAPLYDISSALPYSRMQKRKIKLAMKIGSSYKWWDIRLIDWQATAESMHMDPDKAIVDIAVMASTLPQLAVQLLEQFKQEGNGHPILDSLVAEIHDSCQRLLRKFEYSPDA